MQNKFGNFIGGFIAGRATSGSATTLVDSNNNYEADMLIGKVVVIEINGIQYVRKITDNDATSITFATITPSTVAAGTEYQIQQPEGANMQLSGSNVVYTGQQSSAGTATQLTPTSTACHKVTVKAKYDNIDALYVGALGVTTLTGYQLSPGEEHTFDANNANLLYIISTTSGDGVSWGAE